MRSHLMRATASLLCLATAMPALAQSYAPVPYGAAQPPVSAMPLMPPDGGAPPPPDGPYAGLPGDPYGSGYGAGTPYGSALLPPEQAPAPLSAAQIDQLMAPVALYPDELLSQLLMAATYPLDVVEANRWLGDPRNAALRGDALPAALELQPWDPSVKALVPFPQVLRMLDERLDWTQQIGRAFLDQQDEVMNSVQRLRQQASANGALQSTPQQRILQQEGLIEIQPAQPDVVYVPSYDPRQVYGAWAYPDYPPLYFAPPPGYVVSRPYGYLGFGAGVAVVGALWGWNHWDWRRRHIAIDAERYRRLNFGRPPIRQDVWVHDRGRDRGFSQRNAAPRYPDRNRSYDRAAPAYAGRSFGDRAAPVPARPFAADRAGPPQRWSRDGAAPSYPPRAPAAPQTFSRRDSAPQPLAQPPSQPQRGQPPGQWGGREQDRRSQLPQPAPQAIARPAPSPAQPAARSWEPQRFSQRPSGPPQAQTFARPDHGQPQMQRPAPPPQAQHAAPPPPQRPAPPPQVAQRPPPPQRPQAAPPQPQQPQGQRPSGDRRDRDKH